MEIRARENPFENERVESLLKFEPQWLGQSWSDLMTQLNNLEYRAAIVGPHGSGKTTFLSSLKERLLEQGLKVESFFLNDRQRTLSELDWCRLTAANEDGVEADERIVMLDGAEQLSWRNWRRFKKSAKRCRGLIITQHRPGKLPLLLKTETNLGMFRAFTQRLAPDYHWKSGIVESIYTRSNGNVREGLWQCYDLMATGGLPEFD